VSTLQAVHGRTRMRSNRALLADSYMQPAQ